MISALITGAAAAALFDVEPRADDVTLTSYGCLLPART